MDGKRYRDLLAMARAARAADRACFPLSGMHYMEMSGIKDPGQRRDIAGVMEELSRFQTLLCRSLVMRLELEAVLDVFVGHRTVPYSTLEVVGSGWGHAFGIQGQLRIESEAGGSTEAIRADWPGGPRAHDEFLAELQRHGERAMLEGPADDELDELRKDGYDAATAKRGAERRAEQEREQAARFDQEPRWRRGRLRDVVAVRYLIVELFDMLTEGLAARGVDLDALPLEDRASVRQSVDAMPSGDVHVSLQVEMHRDSESQWSSNDFFDLDSMALAVPYCDVVATDKQRQHQIKATGCHQRLSTVLTTTPQQILVELATERTADRTRPLWS